MEPRAVGSLTWVDTSPVAAALALGLQVNLPDQEGCFADEQERMESEVSHDEASGTLYGMGLECDSLHSRPLQGFLR